METKTLKISLEKAKELYKNGSEDIKTLLLETFTREELESKTLPTTWEEYCENHYCKGYYLDGGSTIHPFTLSNDIKLIPDSDKNTVESKENGEAILALCQLIRLRDEYNGHKPIDYDAEYPYRPYSIVYDIADTSYKIVSANKYSQYKRLFVFHTEELAIEFLKNFKPLLDTFYKIMY